MIRSVLATLLLVSFAFGQSQRWTEQAARDWYARQPWLVGANYIPSTAINELEMWQAETFDPKRIDTELGWAESIGMNSMRVFLHDLLWEQDAAGYKKRIDIFLGIAAKHNIRPMFVLFDSCWDPFPKIGRQRAPKPGVHNSGWMQSPGAEALMDRSQHARLEAYVKGVVGTFANDDRVLAWDVWNEPDNLNRSHYGKFEPAGKLAMVNELLPKTFEWARSAKPKQPITCGVWKGDWSLEDKLTATDKIQLEMSDVISFHSYEDPVKFEKRIRSLARYNRPILCTEYMARGNGSTFQGSMPIGKKYNVAMINWGLVAGKTQTYLPWDSWQHPYTDREPAIWFHEVFRTDGRPYKTEETDFIRKITGTTKAKSAAGGL